MAQIDWRFIQPLDQSGQIANLALGNNQINTGVSTAANALLGYADNIKKQNTDQILNALMQSKTSADLPNAMSAVQALQQQFGQGYDQAAVRNAVDTRGSTLAQRDAQQLSLQQAQANQAAIPQLNEIALARMKAAGASPDQIAAASAVQGVDITQQANQLIGDQRNDRDFAYRQQRDAVGDSQWAASNERADVNQAMQMSSMFERAPQVGWTTDAQGNLVQTQTPGVTKGDAFTAIMQSLYSAESGNRHRDKSGNLITSPKGALGVAQIMPSTAAKPGYGMKPINLQTTSAEEQKAWSAEYFARVAQKEGFTTEQAVAAYNAGAGKVKQAIASGGANWLSKLPAETQAYVPKVLGKAGKLTSAAGTGVVPTDAINKAVTGYQEAFAKLNATYAAEENKSQIKGSLASTGNSLETWASSNRGKDNTFFTNAGDLVSMARQNAEFNKLPESAQINIMKGAFAKMNDVNAFQFVPDTELKKFISDQTGAYKTERVSKFNADKNALVEQAYQQVVSSFKSAGVKPPNRQSVMQALGMQTTGQPVPVNPVPQPKQQAKPAAKPQPSNEPKVNSPSKMDAYMAQREAKKKAQRDAVDARMRAEEAAKPKPNNKPQLASANIRIGNTSMSQSQLDDILKKYKPS